jgi:hypothetical protein
VAKKKQFNKLVRQYMATGDPINEANFGGQAASLYGQYQDTMKLLRFQRGTIKRQAKDARAGIKDQRTFDTQAAAGAALERGALGSSADVEARQQVASTAASALAANRGEQANAVSGNIANAMAARRDYQSGVLSLLQQQAAARSMGSTEKYLNKLLDSLASGGGGKGKPGDGKPGDGKPNGDGNPGGGGGGPVPLLSSFGEIKALSNPQTEALKRRITRKMQQVHSNLEDKGYTILNSPDANKVLKFLGPNASPQTAQYLTKLYRRRNFINDLLDVHSNQQG